MTTRLARALRGRGWQVLTTHHPGAQVGVYVLQSPRPRPATKGAVVLDLVAKRGRAYLLVESKDRYWVADARKVLRVSTQAAYRESLAERFGVDWAQAPVLIPGIALPASARVPAEVPEGVVVVRVTPRGMDVVRGKHKLPGARAGRLG